MKLLTTCASQAEALVIQSKLNYYKIKNIIKSKDIVALYPSMADSDGTPIYVDEKDYKKAVKILNEIND